MNSSNPSSTPTPGRSTAPGASLRTQRPTTYYDTEKDSQARPIQSEPKPNRPPPPSRGFPGGPKPASSGQSRHLPSHNVPKNQSNSRPAQEKSKIGAALLNKRQSVSYGLVAAKSPPQPLPPLPPLPGRSGNRHDDRIAGVSKNQSAQSFGVALDLDTLAQDNFDAQQFMKIHLAAMGGAASDPETLRSFKNSLRTTHLSTNQELQENAYKNYSAFVAISKEIATLENEMLELKSVLEEFRTLPNDLDMGLGMVDENNFGEVKRKGARNSIADVNALYKTQLEGLWENVEGSQKFLPLQLGRHIVSESTTFVELNPITYQPKQAVHLFLLNDSLLIALRKQTRMGSGKVKLTAEKCFNLAQISIVDLNDAPDMKYAIQIQRNQEKVVLRTDRLEEKRALLNSFQKVTEEMARKKRKQSVMEAELRTLTSEMLKGHSEVAGMGNLNSSTPFSGYSDPHRPGESAASQFQPSKFLGFGKDDPTGRDLSWIGDVSDELSVAIACRQFDSAINLVEKSKLVLVRLSSDQNGRPHTNLSAAELNAHNTLKSKVEEKSHEILTKLLDDLLEPTVRKSQLVRIAQLITRLSGGTSVAGPNIERAKESFLAMRSELVRRQSRQIKFEGDLLLWVSQSSFVLFTLVKNTCEWYMTAFRDNRMASGFVRWAVEQMEAYGQMFRRQVYEGEEDNGAVAESIAVTKVHAGMLKEVGLDFGFLLDSVLVKPGHGLRRTNGRRRSVGDQDRPFNPELSGSLRRQKSWGEL